MGKITYGKGNNDVPIISGNFDDPERLKVSFYAVTTALLKLW